MSPRLETLVMPCFNEAERLDVSALVALVDSGPHLHLVAVDDGSTDTTPAVLDQLRRERPQAVTVVSQHRNQGKAEAVRRGLCEALAKESDIVGFFDADLATPVEELLRLLAHIRRGDCDVLLASRVCLLGRHIERKPSRHYLGRIFASAASLTLGLRVYDTQCGTKLFRRTRALEAAVTAPFLSRWVFDVELLGRLTRGPYAIAAQRIREEPLQTWRDVPGSKLSSRQMLGAAEDLARIAWWLHGR